MNIEYIRPTAVFSKYLHPKGAEFPLLQMKKGNNAQGMFSSLSEWNTGLNI